MSDRIARGKAIFERALGYAPTGFRGPCLSMSANTYQALANHGFVWSSNEVVNPMGWRYINKDYDAGEPWQPNVPPHPYRYTAGIIEIPMVSEYTWYLTPEDMDRLWDDPDFCRLLMARSRADDGLDLLDNLGTQELLEYFQEVDRELQ